MIVSDGTEGVEVVHAESSLHSMDTEYQEQLEQLEEQGIIHCRGAMRDRERDGLDKDDDTPTMSDCFTDARDFPDPETIEPMTHANLAAASAYLLTVSGCPVREGNARFYGVVQGNANDRCKYPLENEVCGDFHADSLQHCQVLFSWEPLCFTVLQLVTAPNTKPSLYKVCVVHGRGQENMVHFHLKDPLTHQNAQL